MKIQRKYFTTSTSKFIGLNSLKISITALAVLTFFSSSLARQGAPDESFENLYVVTNSNNGGEGSLRWAIQQANASDSRDKISFNISGTGPHVIDLANALDWVTWPVIIDGSTQPGYEPGNPQIVIDGSEAPEGASGIRLNFASSGSIIRGLSIVGFKRQSVSPFFGGDGIYVLSSDNFIQSNLLGMLPDGTVKGNEASGIEIDNVDGDNAFRNMIGGLNTVDRNFISGSEYGITLRASHENKIYGNYLGVSRDGSEAAANGVNVFLINANDNEIGGIQQGAGNVISGAATNGITILGITPSTSENNLIRGNYIGTSANGLNAIPNREGIVFRSGGVNNVVGGSTESARNIISGNSADGIFIWGTSSTAPPITENLIAGNFIGININGEPLSNRNGILSAGNVGRNFIGDPSMPPNIISGNTSNGISLNRVDDFVIRNNRIGTSADGLSAVPNQTNGIFVGGSDHMIGGDNPGDRNLISGNGETGIRIDRINNESAEYNTVRGNLIGTNLTGQNSIPNGSNGILVRSSNNVIGGNENNRNIISGNVRSGILLATERVADNTVSYNLIGTDISGFNQLGNGEQGIELFNGRDNIFHKNVISGNGQIFSSAGIMIRGSLAEDNRVTANFIGTTFDGNDPLPNNGTGILVYSSNNIIGGDNPEDGNIISGNTGSGIFIIRFNSTGSNNVIRNNKIGVGSDSVTEIGNGNAGIYISGGSNNLIGGESGVIPAYPNVVANNGAAGIVINTGQQGDIPLSNTILANSIYKNGGIGIDLGDNGKTLNDADDSDTGPNNLQNYPEIESFTHFPDQLQIDISYAVPSDPQFSAYPLRIEFYKADESEQQGLLYLGFDIYSESDFEEGLKTFPLGLTSLTEFNENDLIIATATDANGNTSEFSSPPLIEKLLVVTNTDDSGPGSLRWAIDQANSTAARDSIVFDIQGSGPHVIQPNTQFISFTQPVVLDATTQDGYVHGSPVIILNGNNTNDQSGLVFTATAGNSVIKGFSIVNYDNYAIRLIGSNNVVQGNLIGILPDGNVGGNGYGVSLINSTNNQIGGTSTENRNIISGNNVGIDLGPGSGNNVVEGNFIGTNLDGTSAEGNKFNVQIVGSSNNIIGGSSSNQRNIISGAFLEVIDGQNTGGSGVVLSSGFGTGGATLLSMNNRIIGNYIGTDVTGTQSLSNERAGVLLLFGSSENYVGGEESGEGNLISGNGWYGIFVQGNDELPVHENVIQGNYIGTDVNGSNSLSNDIGIFMMGNNYGNVIGTNGAESGRNLISGNGIYGIFMTGGSENIITGNFIGSDISGQQSLSNNRGLEIQGSDNFIGGEGEFDSNLISGNTVVGIHLNESQGNRVMNNLIGTDSSGSSTIPTQLRGVRISGGSSHIIVGNTVSGHQAEGIRLDNNGISSNGASFVEIKGNFIGTDKDGLNRLPNRGAGIYLTNSFENTIGGVEAEDSNIVSGNGGVFGTTMFSSPGIQLVENSNNNKIFGNFIGTTVTGEIIENFGNFTNGIEITGNSTGNLIGLDQSRAGKENIIAGNGVSQGSGVLIDGDGSVSNRVSGNRMFGNSIIGIDLGGDGITENDADDSDTGPNNLQNYPVIEKAEFDEENNELTIDYRIPSDPSNTAYPLEVEFFINSDNRQGSYFLGLDFYNSEDFGNTKTFILNPEDGMVTVGTELTSVAINENNDTSEFSAVFEITSSPTTPGLVTLLTPANESVGISVNTSFSWEVVENADSYDIQIASDDQFLTASLILFETDISDSGFETVLEFESTYFWRVRAINEIGEGAWSEAWSFTTQTEDVDPPSIVELVSPDDGAVNVPIIPLFIWDIAEGADTYQVQIALDNQFVTLTLITDESGLTDTSFEIDLEYETTYFWRVRATNDGGQGEWSEIWSFTTVEQIISLTQTVEVGPDGGEFTDESTGVVVTFPPGALTETVEINIGTYLNIPDGAEVSGLMVSLSGPDFSPVEFSEPVLIKLKYDPDNLPDGVSEANLKVIKYSQITEEWTELESEVDTSEKTVSAFTTSFSGFAAGVIEGTVFEPGMVTLFSPENEASDVSISPELSWQELQNADTYTLQVSTESNFSDTVIDQQGINAASYQVTDLDLNTTYYWRVRGVNEAGPGEWSEVWSFTTGELSPPGALTLSVTDNNPSLSWGASPSASVSGYNVYRGAGPAALELLTELDASATGYTDLDVPQGGSFYAVTATGPGNSESAFTNAVSFFRVDLQAGNQWQLISHAVSGAQADLSGSLVYGYNRVYFSEQTIEEGHGYWVKNDEGAAYTLAGPGAVQLELDLNAGWNLIGGPAGAIAVDDIDDPSAILTTAPVFGYNGSVYEAADELMPGSGYWLFAETGGQVILSLDLTPSAASSGKMLAAASKAVSSSSTAVMESDRLVVSSGTLSGELVIYGELLTRDEKYRYLRPPLAPGQGLDVRTDEGFSAMDSPSSGLLITAAEYPVTLRLEASSPGASAYVLTGEDQSGSARQWPLVAGAEVVLLQPYVNLILQRASAGEEMISETRLEPGYPNPFNPATNIRYRLAQQGEVLLEVYDLGGRRIATLVNQSQQPGAYTVAFDGSGLASGIYFVRLQAGTYTSIQKLTLIK